MSLDKWVKYVHGTYKPPYVDREKYLDGLIVIDFKITRNIFYVVVKCSCLRKNIHKENVCIIKGVINPECINCEYVRENHKVRSRFNQLKVKALTWFYDYSVIEI